jgi:p-cymene monooxygenase electron transfer component
MRRFIKSLFGSAGPQQTVDIQPQGVTITVSSGQTILEAALSQGVPYPHNCTVGTCGSCKTRLLQGQVKAVSDFGYTLSRQELDAGYILACQAVPRDACTVVEIADPGADLPVPQACTGRIVNTAVLTHDILLVEVATDQPVKYVAGQYASIKAPGLARARNYSFADAPQREGRNSLTFFIRKVPGGEFTEALFAGQLQGKPLAIEAPHGSFYLRPGNGPMVCIAGGSGLAPLISLLEDMRKNRVRRSCTLLFGARTQADLYALDQIANIANAWLEPFRFVPVLSQEPLDSDWTGARGMVTDFIALPGEGDNLADAQGYLCGPPPMIDAGIEKLVAMGVPVSQIHADKFVDGVAPVAAPAARGVPA